MIENSESINTWFTLKINFPFSLIKNGIMINKFLVYNIEYFLLFFLLFIIV